MRRSLLVLLALILAGCAGDTHHRIVISTADQRMILFYDKTKVAEYPVSTSKFGVGDAPGSNATPLGHLVVRRKIGDGVPSGTVFKSRRPTGEILVPDAPGRDPIVTRIIWLAGTEPRNAHAYDRFIYIHGTPEERNIGRPASYGCIRMRSRDVIDLYNRIGPGARVLITTQSFYDPQPAVILPRTTPAP